MESSYGWYLLLEAMAPCEISWCCYLMWTLQLCVETQCITYQ
jgi:hypothetical protein